MTQPPEPAVAHLRISSRYSQGDIRKLSLLVIAEFQEKAIFLLAPRLLSALVPLAQEILTS